MAAHGGLVLAPWGAVEAPGWLPLWLSLPSPALLAVGWRWRSRVALLVGVPLGWALPSYALRPGTSTPAAAAVALLSALAYVVIALTWLRASRPSEALDWRLLEGRRRVAPDLTPMVAGLLVAAPALGACLWPALREAAAIGFPNEVGRAQVGLGLLGTLVGLAVATDLARGRGPLHGSGRRAIVLGTASVGSLAGWLWMSGA